ncbi:protein kinase [Verrucomicrobiota bacterium]
MKFRCPSCSQKLEISTIHSGQAIPCPRCKKQIVIPTADELVEHDSLHSTYQVDLSNEDAARIRQTVQLDIDRGSMTISQFLASKELEGGVDLDEEESTTASRILTSEQGRKYKIGDVVTSGGMGAILDAKDTNLRRDVAMKILLDAREATKEDVLRFIEEAQITSQLEHPSIVPIHELGVDGSGNVFYTMKFIHGVTLEEVLTKIKKGNEKTIEEYPLSRLLNILQRICDAVAFAHSKRVIHRDLKPENIMIGEYGEVQVMDWGIAKVLPQKKRKTKRVAARRPRTRKDLKAVVPQPAVESVRADPSVVSGEDGDILKTMSGAIMGTPGFMAPEQALGETEHIDERTDIYALGAILYNILTLHMPVTGDDVDKVLRKVTRGRIPHPSRYNPSSGRRRKTEHKAQEKTGEPGEIPLAHCPNKSVPDSLSAVAMKALSLKQADRYQSATALQADIEAYQHGFATSAEHAGLGRQVGLLLKRHEGISIAVAAALAVVVGLASWSYINIIQEKNETQKALSSLTKTAPTFYAQARALIDDGKFEEALKNINFAISLRPKEARYHALKGNILQSLLRMKEAWESYWRTLKYDPNFPHAEANKALCAKIYKANKGRKALTPASLAELQQAMKDQGRDRKIIANPGPGR